MTLIVAIKCKDGIVMGADGAATYAVRGQHTIRQSVRNKIRTLGSDQGMVGVAGPVGLGQRIHGEIEAFRNAGKLKGKPYEVMTALRRALWTHIEMEMQISQMASQVTGPTSLQQAITDTLAALVLNGAEPILISFDHQATPDMVTDDVPFVAIGSGQLIADPFLAFIRRLYWPTSQPSLQEGIFAVTWTLRHAIETNAGGVGEPIQIVTLAKKDCKAKRLEEEALEELREAIKGLEDDMASLPAKFLSQKAQPVTIPPVVPQAKQ